MFKDRLHFECGGAHLALCGKTGIILELFSTENRDNILKNSTFKTPQPFELTVKTEQGEVKLFPLDGARVTNEPKTAVKISHNQSENGLLVKVEYNYLTDGENLYPCKLFYTALLLGGKIGFKICVEKVSLAQNEGLPLKEVKFPIFAGVWLGDDYRDDTLVYPKYSGLKYQNPVEYFTKEAVYSNWRWLDYRYNNQLEGVPYCERLEKLGQKGFSDIYPGGLCMSWLDLYDDGGGVYFGVHDCSAKPVRLEAAVFGKSFPGITLSSSFAPITQKEGEKQAFSSPECVLAFHKGDWHCGADIYRAFRLPQIKIADRYPDWVKGEAGLFAHYDFKYQTGEVNHRYSDIPRLADEALAAGFNHMLFAGWQLGGHDGGVPLYVTDDDLGTEKELIEGIAAAK